VVFGVFLVLFAAIRSFQWLRFENASATPPDIKCSQTDQIERKQRAFLKDKGCSDNDIQAWEEFNRKSARKEPAGDILSSFLTLLMGTVFPALIYDKDNSSMTAFFVIFVLVIVSSSLSCSHAFDQNTSDRCLAQDNIEVTMFDDFLLLASASPFHWCISGEE
jgi:hypothetical protein